MLKRHFFYILSLAITTFLACGDENTPDSEAQVSEEEHGQAGMVSLTVAQIQLMKIEIGHPEARQLEGYISAPAKVESIPTRIADIGTLISGRVKEIYAAEGEHVKKGQVLLEIQGLEIGEIRGEYIRSRAVLESARANFERQQKLLQENIAAKRSFIEAQSAYQEAKAVFSAADQKLHSIGISGEEAQKLITLASAVNGKSHSSETSTLKITSPISGTVSKAQVMVGKLVAPEADIMEVVDSGQVWVVADIYVKNLVNVHSGQRVEILTEAYPDVVFESVLEYMSPVVDEATRTVKVRTTINNGEGYLKPQMFATMRVFTESSQHSLVVPESAVQNDGEIDFVFVLQEKSEKEQDSETNVEAAENHAQRMNFRKVPVQVGMSRDGFIQIVAGLSGKEQIVTKGSFFLKSEMMKESFGEEE